MEPRPEPASPDDGADGERASTAGPETDTGTDLDRMRRQTRWLSLGIVCALGMVGIAAVAATEPLGPVVGVAVVTAVAGSLAAGRLVDRRIAATTPTAGPDDDAIDGPLVAVAVVAGLVYTVVAQVADAGPFPAVADEPQASWFAVPAVANIAVVVTVARQRWVLAGLLGGLVAMVVAAAARFLVVGDLEWAWLVLEGGLVAGWRWARGPNCAIGSSSCASKGQGGSKVSWRWPRSGCGSPRTCTTSRDTISRSSRSRASSPAGWPPRIQPRLPRT